MGTKEPVVIVFTSNDDFAMLLGVAICSLFENKKGDYPVQVFVIDGGISPGNKTKLAVLEKRYRFTITYVTPDRELFAGIRPAGMQIELPLETYYRTAIGRILPAARNKAIYMDVDVVVRGDIGELFYEDLGGKTLGAVADCYQDRRREHLKNLFENTNIPAKTGDAAYFNAGVLLIDLNRWRKLEIEKKLFNFMRGNPGKLFYHDQDALNVVLSGDSRILPAKYNFLAEYAEHYGEHKPLIVHYAGGAKPWYVFSALPYQSDYVYYANKTPWKNRKYRKLVDVPFAKKYHFYPIAWALWSAYKKTKRYFLK